MHTIFCLKDSNGIVMRGTENLKFPKQTKRIN